VAHVRTDVSEECIASIIRVTRIGEPVFLRSVLRLLVTADVVPSSLIPVTLSYGTAVWCLIKQFKRMDNFTFKSLNRITNPRQNHITRNPQMCRVSPLSDPVDRLREAT
jgi:hypothetical protein